MIARLFSSLAIVGLAWITEAAATTVVCPNGAPASAAGICPILVQGDPSCNDAAQICNIVVSQQLLFNPPPGSQDGVTVSFVGATTVNVKDTFPSPDQQRGRPGIETVITRGSGAYIYCGISVLNDIVTAPGSEGPQAPDQVRVCFANGPCGLTPTQVTNACNVYNPSPTTRTADFLQAYRVGPTQQVSNVCGCSPSVARDCDPRAPIFAGGYSSTSGRTYSSLTPRFVSCNPGSVSAPAQPAPLKAAEAEGTTTIGTNTCVLRTIGGRRILVNSTSGTLC
jgi:hypothetical protein